MEWRPLPAQAAIRDRSLLAETLSHNRPREIKEKTQTCDDIISPRAWGGRGVRGGRFSPSDRGRTLEGDFTLNTQRPVMDGWNMCRRSFQGIKLHVSSGRGAEQCFGSFSRSSPAPRGIYTRVDLNHACVCEAVDSYRSSRGIEVTCGGYYRNEWALET
ncbi:hypothetical protein EVAR_28758_1 [Eumeta japonica]|uniref:Uncharacterized protein n=1 Tax=Eumeta variegata TaxID=151549 RepID=A0A4C1VEF0_EUMVA|nr:hypothetical protein EVAR_28758_1 [Eumeta japonica]